MKFIMCVAKIVHGSIPESLRPDKETTQAIKELVLALDERIDGASMMLFHSKTE